MYKLAQRIGRRIRATVSAFCADCKFSVRLAFLRIGEELLGRLGAHAVASRSKEKKDLWIQDYLKNNLSDVLKRFAEDNSCGEYIANAPIWVCWWTGEESAPPLVQQCIRSIRKNAGVHPVYLITKQNYREYVEIPHYIYCVKILIV